MLPTIMTTVLDLFGTLKQLNSSANRHAGKLLVLGLGAVALHNWRQWQRDKAFLADTGQMEPLPPLDTWPNLPRVSVLVGAWNEASNIERHIHSFLSLRYPHKELVLCAGGTDGTYEIAAKHAHESVKLLQQQPGEGKQRALARSLPQTTGDVIYLTDADCQLDDDSFERTLRDVALGREDVCTGGCRPFPEQLHLTLVVSRAASDLRMYSESSAPLYLPGLLGRNCAIARKRLESSGEFSQPAPTGTDYVLAKQLTGSGARIRQVRESQIATEYPTTISAHVRQQRRWLRNVAWYGRQYGATDDVVASLRTSAFSAALLMGPIFAVALGELTGTVWLLAYLHVVVSRVRYMRFFELKTETRLAPEHYLAQSVVPMLDFVAWTLPLTDYFSAKRRNSW